MRVAVLLALSGCYVGNYRNLGGDFIGKRTSVGCLDVAVALTDDGLAHAPIVAYQFGNRCTHRTLVDLAAVRVTGTVGDHQVELARIDPRHEIAPMHLDAWSSGDERIAYEPAPGMSPGVVCVDLGKLDAGAPGPPVWTCLGADGGNQ